jgi:hypothetical protein
MATKIVFKDKTEFIFDAVTDISENNTATMTSNKIEDGSTVSDHVILDPQKVTLACEVSSASRFIGDEANRHLTCDQLLSNAYRNKQPVTIFSKEKVYKDRIILGYDPKKSSGDGKGDSLIFNLNLGELRKTKFKTSKVDKEFIGRAKANQTAAQGKKEITKTQQRHFNTIPSPTTPSKIVAGKKPTQPATVTQTTKTAVVKQKYQSILFRASGN